MPLDYEIDSQLKELTEISAEYLEWFIGFTKQTAFVGEGNAEQVTYPESFTAWFERTKAERTMDEGMLESLEECHNKLKTFSETTLSQPLPISVQSYSELSENFEQFTDALRRVEKELILDENGIDEVTGLRRKSVMAKDLDREMQRLSRQGKPFSLALVSIDNFDAISKEEGKEGTLSYLMHIAGLIKQSLRSFDDAYRTDKAEFILSLKQADVTGGIRALERLKELLELNSFTFKSENLNSSMVSLSCCVAEPLPDDSTDALIENMRKDLEGNDKEDRTVLEYYELSPLQRYIQSN